MIRSISLRNVLSFGSAGADLELGPLTVLIGANGCGKSNVLEVMYLLSRLSAGGADDSLPIIDWIWKGVSGDAVARIEVVTDPPTERDFGLRHRLEFKEEWGRFVVENEIIEDVEKRDPHAAKPFFYYSNQHGNIWVDAPADGEDKRRRLRREDIDAERSILAQRNDHEVYPKLEYLGRLYRGVRVYRDINFGPKSPTRVPQRTDVSARALLEDGSNLGLIINRLRTDPAARQRLDELLRRFYETAKGVDVEIVGGTVQVCLFEQDWKIPATRLSDGTMRWLTLLAILLDPWPPKVVCLDEPDLGLHPDIIPALTDLLEEASKRMQIIVTTHSDVLVDGLTEHPESIVVCEKQDGATSLRRLDRAQLQAWLKDYSLGDLWNSGQIGGRRF